jgi:hypothetical protein
MRSATNDVSMLLMLVTLVDRAGRYRWINQQLSVQRHRGVGVDH